MPNAPYVAFSGRAEGTSQALILSTGECGTSAYLGPVPCSQPHDEEVTGTIDLTRRVANPPDPSDDSGWGALVGADCARLAHNYLGFGPKGDVNSGWVPIQAGSWAAGRRVLECTVAHFRGGEALMSTGSLKTFAGSTQPSGTSTA